MLRPSSFWGEKENEMGKIIAKIWQSQYTAYDRIFDRYCDDLFIMVVDLIIISVVIAIIAALLKNRKIRFYLHRAIRNMVNGIWISMLYVFGVLFAAVVIVNVIKEDEEPLVSALKRYMKIYKKYVTKQIKKKKKGE